MADWSRFLQNAQSNGILDDTNLLVLLIVGSVNGQRISRFKRTSRYTLKDYEMLAELIGRVPLRFTVTHVLAEVSNLTDLPGAERAAARIFLRSTVSRLKEVPVASRDACEVNYYPRLGLADAAIAVAVQRRDCSVLTDNMNLYLALATLGVTVGAFRHLRQFRTQ